MYFAAVAGMQYTLDFDMEEHPSGIGLSQIANNQVLHILGIPLDPDAAQTSDYAHAGTDPVKLIDKNISCRDKRSGLVVDYLVIT